MVAKFTEVIRLGSKSGDLNIGDCNGDFRGDFRGDSGPSDLPIENELYLTSIFKLNGPAVY